MDIDVQSLRDIVINVGFIPLLILIGFFGLYTFWREASLTRKNRSSVFDMFLFVIICTVVWGRLTYIFSSAAEYNGLPWFIFPYEKYADGFYLFRLLPWRYFRVWDGGFLFTGSFVAAIISGFVYSTFVKKWLWKQMMNTVYVPAILMLSVTLLFSGLLVNAQSVINQGIVLGSIAVTYLGFSWFIHRGVLLKMKFYENLFYLLNILFTVVSSSYVVFSLLASDITQWDRWNIYLFGGFTLLALLLYMYDVTKVEVNIETKTNIRTTISTNQPIRIRKSEDR
jgi:hypothetical protein